jgi:hypothetical protein
MNKIWKRVGHSWRVGQNVLCDNIQVDVHAWNYMVLLDCTNKLCARTELHIFVHAWNYVIMLNFNNKLCVGTELDVVFHAWNYMILLDFNNKLCVGTELHVIVHAWNHMILLDFSNKLCARTEMHVDVSYQFVLSATNQCSLLNYVICSKRGVCCWIVLSAMN